MLIYASCHEADAECESGKRFAVAYLSRDEKPRGLHMHDTLEIFICLSGGRSMYISDRQYEMRAGDVFLINPFEAHQPIQEEGESFERYILCLHPDYLMSLCTAKTDLRSSFYLRPEGFEHRRSLSRQTLLRVQGLLHAMAGEENFGADVMENALMTELIVTILRLYQETPIAAASAPQLSEMISKVLAYVNQGITGELSLENVAGAFFLSKGYLSRTFHEETGTTLQRYIVTRRISLAKRLLCEGANVRDTCEKCGFGDYSHFIRTFSREVGVSPKQYASTHMLRSSDAQE
ncbi:MAG: AraC family transcriptional regulator [Eubacteriales bacterium]|nr:AraC family transcriptional regulator [Eubacteriales bacterium]MDD3882721.1 AraC family transcriptional regulator [Eubacteriales bacterium]MDD4512658.1 AraC family transcriptional regulator [Eubacteriales bacterium]